MTEQQNYFERFAQHGFTRLVPVIPPEAKISERSSLFKRLNTKQDGRGKTPGVKGRNGDWYSFDWVPYEADSEDYARWHTMGAGVGIKTGSGLIAIDADTLNEDYAKIIKQTVDEFFGEMPIRIGNYPKALYLLRVNGLCKYQRIDFGEAIISEKGDASYERVEILSDGKFFVAQGTHPKTKKPYSWIKPVVDLDKLPVAEPEQITNLLETLRKRLPAASEVVREGGTSEVDQASLRGDYERIKQAVEAMPNTSALFPTREAYRNYGYAIKAALPDDEQAALDLFADWCDRWADGDNDRGVIEADWKRMKPPYRRGASWLYELADKHSDGKFSTAAIWFEDLENPENPFTQISENEKKSEKPKRKFEFLKYADVVATGIITNPALIKGLLDQGAMSVLYGDSNVGKTFVAMDLAFHIGAGLDYGGLRTTRGLVVYIAAEGGNGAKKRLHALRDKFPGIASDFVLLPASVDLLRPDADLVPLVEGVRGLGVAPALVVVDTLSRALAGGDENSSVDMGALVKNLDALRRALAPAHLMVVHHTGKDKARGARGHSLLRAATDTEIEVADGVVTATKQRDMDKGFSREFTLVEHKLGFDSDGDVITSLTVRLGQQDGGAADREGVTKGETAFLDGLAVLADTAAAGDGSFKLSEILAYFKATLSSNAVRTHLKKLKKRGFVLQKERGLWLLAENALVSDCVQTCGHDIF